MLRISRRAQSIAPFYVMEVAKAAAARAAEVAHTDRPMVFLNIGEPDFSAPPLVQAAAARAIEMGRTQYTDALGLWALRQRIADWYATRFGVTVAPERIAITAGASAALQLACLALVEPGDEVLMPDPCYPCNRQFVQAAGGTPKLLASSAEQRFQLSADQAQAHWGPATRGVLLASPSNPTGTSIARAELERIADLARSRGGFVLMDEIYLGLSYDDAFGQTALSLPGAEEHLVSINSFSKYFNMTGWRLGWLVLPPALVGPVERLAQNLFICASAVAQHAALACFEQASLAEYERRRQQFRARRDLFVPALNALGLTVPVMPDGAFYAYADCSDWCERLGHASSWELAFDILQRANVAVTPGKDFGVAEPGRYLRFSTASSMTQLQEAISRLQAMAP